MTINAHGKLLLTGEYFVLSGAMGLALPARYGQSVQISAGNTPHRLCWESRDSDGHIWFAAEYDLPSLTLMHSSDATTAETLRALLFSCRAQRSTFLNQSEGLQVQTQTNFPRAWGLGTSSTLIAALGRWAEVDPYPVLFDTLGGSGYDVACAFADAPILYRLAGERMPEVKSVHFKPPFADALYFIYLEKKQDSREGISRYRERVQMDTGLIHEITALTYECLQSEQLKTFERMMATHETIISQALDLPRAKDLLFPDYWGEVKSLGAWGGDFVLATSEHPAAEVREYFQKKGLETVLTWQDMIG